MSVKKNSVSEILYAKVFTNQHLLENILIYLSDDFRKNLDVRLVNKSINNTFLRLIRRDHQTIKIEYAYNVEDIETREKDYIYINYRKINNQGVPLYFIFLNTAVGVKVQKITTRRLWMLENEFKRRLHDLIHSQLIGSNGTHIQSLINLEELCNRCEKCSNIAKKCLEYGPLRFSTLQTMSYSKNYKKLHVTDKLFEDIAEYCISKSKNKEECFKELDKTIPSIISCDKLAIWINLKFKHVEVSLSYSRSCVASIGNPPPETTESAGYHNFIPNIRRLFPTDQISMELTHWYFVPKIDIEKKMSTILQVVTMEKPQKLSLDIKFFVQSGIVKKLNEETNREELLGIDPRYVLQPERLHCFKKSSSFNAEHGPEVFLDNKWIGRRFQVEDTVNRFNFNLDVYIKEKELEEKFDKEMLQTYPNSFVGHFFA
ncbi:hypothetical protein GCK72_011448 [Caenorhabditis remanei]|uniref:Uncharacterized protein n=1 Tax=Caenorhabditis remanei TaxID=31234 RepID=A0A6A5H9V3_CAERE|nr:hypothetical protein GCK72_011448 [Caenorhabditis remanei]KAF1763182.1 hypothetical protein GCK72_011448 [Caenorhabditis remanei]